MRTFLKVAASAALLFGCGDPLANVGKLSDVTLAADAPTRANFAAPDVDGGRGSGGEITVMTEVRADDVPYGVMVPFGAMGRACEARHRSKGTRIEKSTAGFALYDTRPGSTRPRTFYVTGFADGCPRQFTAALAMFGAPSLHEQLRYGRPSDDFPYSEIDEAYERVKSAICRVGRSKPCGGRIERLERNTVFISTYERFAGNGRWANILVHDGAVLAAAVLD